MRVYDLTPGLTSEATNPFSHIQAQIENAHAQTGKLQIDVGTATSVSGVLEGRLNADYAWQEIIAISGAAGEVWDCGVMPEMRWNPSAADGTYKVGIGV